MRENCYVGNVAVLLGLSTNQNLDRVHDITPTGYGARGGEYGKISPVSSPSAPQH